MIALPAVSGSAAPGFEAVRREFERNLAERGELGAAFAVVADGETLVDLWGGVADRRSARPWTSDTLQIMFSGTKGLVAACILLLVERHRLTLDAPVARYWPEFAAGGKAAVTVRDVLAHTAGVPGLDTPVSWQQAMDAERMAELLARQPLSDDPRAGRTYHAMTFGWLCGELVRRVDGRSVGAFFADEFAGPLGLELWIGLQRSLEHRVSTVELASTIWETGEAPRDAFRESVVHNPRRYEPDDFPWNDPRWHAAEVPSSNAIGTARSVARFYAGLPEILSEQTLELARRPLSRSHDPLLDQPTAFGAGFQLQTDRRPLGPPDDAFGHGGFGGSMHGCWPEQGVAFSYAMNLLRGGADRRAAALLEALHPCLRVGAAS